MNRLTLAARLFASIAHALLGPATVLVEVEAFGPTQSYELSDDLLDAVGSTFTGKLHGTIHQTSPRAEKP